MATAFINTPFELPAFETNYSISNPKSKPIILTPFLRLSSELQFFYQSKELDARPYLSQRERIERLLSRCTSVLGVQIWFPDPALVKTMREMFCFCIRVVCVSSEVLPAA
ncbi:hypothetical protein BPAE_0224g00130 [Botrytis paeoniae]|uniref:Uncharacterized protein n=1 Tax=Botrytis paeoniae TaxID=278948 RepID=A0A4Z1F9X1_9HELO|nr:hypothetical protein BPAE_0224g00130 [Botrytis paeoniae]